jgi:ubiquinone/menaquinone biosynthesis C-methylase UbiE
VLSQNLKRAARWHLAQEYQKRNQLNKKAKLLESDIKLFISERYRYSFELFELMSKYKQITNNSKIIEVGSGPHGVSFFYPQRRTVAVDPLAHFYKQQFSFIQSGVTANIVQGQGEKLPFSPKSFDFVVSDNVLDHTSDAQAFMLEMRRVLVDGGLLLLTVNVHHWMYSLFGRIFDFLFRIDIVPNFPNYRTHTYFFTLAGLKRLVRQNGFKILFVKFSLNGGQKLSNFNLLNYFRPFKNSMTVFVCSKA